MDIKLGESVTFESESYIIANIDARQNIDGGRSLFITVYDPLTATRIKMDADQRRQALELGIQAAKAQLDGLNG